MPGLKNTTTNTSLMILSSAAALKPEIESLLSILAEKRVETFELDGLKIKFSPLAYVSHETFDETSETEAERIANLDDDDPERILYAQEVAEKMKERLVKENDELLYHSTEG